MSFPTTYLNNNSLKAAGVQISYSKEQLEEYVKCARNPLYFIKNHVKIVSLDHGVVPFNLYSYQERLISAIHNNKSVLAKLWRQSGKTISVAAYIAWYILFNDNKTVAILANKQAIAIEIFARIQFIIENLPFWLQQGILEWNKKSLVLENQSRCIAAASSPSAIRGMSVNFLLLDEFAHLGSNLADEFMASVFPTISSSESAKLVIISTPNGLNHYHKLWIEARNKLNDFIPIEGHWTENPTRTQKWADEQKQKLGEVKYRQEIETEFTGSSYTLIDGVKLASIPIVNPIYHQDFLEIFEEPKETHSYVITVDVSRGRHLDYSAFTVIDVSSMPYTVVAIYKNNAITTMEYPHLIYNTARQYNDSYLLIELNDLGEEVSNTIWHDYEYENMYFSKDRMLSYTSGYPGVYTTHKIKMSGCSILKELIEKNQLILNSYKIIEELGVFVLSGKSYAAENTLINDDLTSTLWLFSWLTKQDIFQELTNIDLRTILTQQKQEYIDASLTPFGFYENHIPEEPNEKDNLILPSKDHLTLTDDQIELLNF